VQYGGEDMVSVVVGNKSDRAGQRQVSMQEGRAWAEGRGFWFLETSARTQAGVEAGFLQLVDSVLQRPGLWEQQGGQGNSGKPGPGLLQEEERQAQQRPCCN